MDKNIFRYIWQKSRREQILLLVLALVSLPFYFYSMDIPKYIVNDAIQGRAFSGGKTEITIMTMAIQLPAWLGGARWPIFDGISVERMTYLFYLSGMFLLLVCINGAFKFIINVRKGTLGESLLRGLRFDLFGLLRPLHARGAARRQAVRGRDHHQGRGGADRRLRRRRLHLARAAGGAGGHGAVLHHRAELLAGRDRAGSSSSSRAC